MSRKLHRLLQVVAGLSVLFCGLGIVNLMLSLKYETQENDCISVVDGRDLCQAQVYNWIGLGSSLLLIVVLSLLKVNSSKSVQ